MAEWLRENTVLTKLGNKLLSYAVAGVATLDLTRVIVRETVSTAIENSGYDLSSVDKDIKQTGRLLKYRGGIQNPDTGDYDTSLITVRISNEELPDTESFKIRQIILMARLTDIDTSAITQYDPGFEDPGEVPYIVAQTTNEGDYDFMPRKSENPTSYDYDIYVVHAGTANVTISIQKTGYVSELDCKRTVTEIKTLINNIVNSKAGENTEGLTFQVWTPQYTEDDDPNGKRVWSKSVDESGNVITTEYHGQKSAERFNMYEDNNNIAVGNRCHVEGFDNVGLVVDGHIEGVENHSGSENNWGTHMEGRRNYATLGWFQHIEGENNQSSGYVTHMEGRHNKATTTEIEGVGILHVEGGYNTIKDGIYHHVEGHENSIEKGNCHHVEGHANTVKGQSDCNHVSGQYNNINNCGEITVSGRENTLNSSNQSIVSGTQNTVSNSEKSNVSGNKNTVVDSERAVASGNGNTVTQSRGTSISGDSNYAIENCYESYVSGYKNRLTRSKHTLTHGEYNTVTDCNNDICSGYSNQVSEQVNESVVSGRENVVRNNLRTSTNCMLISGRKCRVTDSSESVVSGLNNTVTYAVHSVILGNSNKIVVDSSSSDKCVEDSLVSGSTNTVERTVRSNITGLKNTVTDYKPNGVSGERSMSSNNSVSGENNTLNGIFSSVSTGTSNNVTNIHDSFIGGRRNVVSSTVPDGDSNCVLCTGFECVVTSSGSPIFVTGSHNNISGKNSSVFGRNNIVSSEDQVVYGRYNMEDTSNKYSVIVGGGTSDLNRSNIMTLDWSGVLSVKDIILGDNANSLVSRLTSLENLVNQLLSSGGTV